MTVVNCGCNGVGDHEMESGEHVRGGDGGVGVSNDGVVVAT